MQWAYNLISVSGAHYGDSVSSCLTVWILVVVRQHANSSQCYRLCSPPPCCLSPHPPSLLAAPTLGSVSTSVFLLCFVYLDSIYKRKTGLFHKPSRGSGMSRCQIRRDIRSVGVQFPISSLIWQQTPCFKGRSLADTSSNLTYTWLDKRDILMFFQLADKETPM